MSLMLLIVIYTAFVGLGIPDSLFGTAWPAVYREFELPVSFANFETVITFGATMLSSLLSARVIKRLGTARTTAFSTALTAAALLGYSVSGSYIWIYLLAVPLGLGAGAVDAALNNYVSLYYKASHMSFLHCFYGVGVSLSPYLMSFALAAGSWRAGYRSAFYIQLFITAVLFLSLPLWKKVRFGESEKAQSDEVKVLSVKELLKMTRVRKACLIFMLSCGIEYTCGTWGSTFLVNSKGMAPEAAARLVTFYYVGITLGRFVSGLVSVRLSERKIICIGQAAVLLAIVMIALPLPAAVAAVGLFMVGLGNGPLYPNLVHLTPENFGKDISQSVMGVQMAAASVGIMSLPAIFGFAAQVVGTDAFAYYLLALFALMAFETLCLFKRCGKR